MRHISAGEFDALLTEIIDECSASQLMSLPGVYEPVAEYFNNEVLQRWEDSHPTEYRNYYRCPDDGEEWEDVWLHACNDRCPVCNKEITPYKSEEV